MADEKIPIELSLKYRPRTFKEIVGQPDAVKTLVEMGRNGKIPHALLFTGPSGCGKTSLARVVARALKCEEVHEYNSADCRGIDEIRGLSARVGAKPMSGPVRVWIIDEAHGLTPDAQNAFLKTLEEPPDHAFFFLCTTDPQKLKATIKSRCTEIKVKLLSAGDMAALVNRVAAAEGITVEAAVVEKIAAVADGHARNALVLLHSVVGIQGQEARLNAIEANDVRTAGFDIARALMKPGTKWPEVADLLKKCGDEPEGVRRVILGYANTTLLNSGNPRAALIIEYFRDPLYDVLGPGLTAICFAIVTGK